jgi:DNA-damage-inducible protein J
VVRAVNTALYFSHLSLLYYYYAITTSITSVAVVGHWGGWCCMWFMLGLCELTYVKVLDFNTIFLHILIVMQSSLQKTEQIMSKTATIQTRIDPRIKKNAKKVLDKLHISMSEAISMFLTQVSLNQGIPFEIKIPNELTGQTLKNSEKGKELHPVENIESLFEELDK